MFFSFADEVSDTDGSTLGNGNTEQKYEHDNVHAVGSRSQCFYAEHIDEIGDDELRGIVGNLFSCRGQTDFHQVAEFVPRERSEIGEREARNQSAVHDGQQDNHRHSAAKCCRDGGSFHSQCRQPEFTENQRVVADDVHDVDNECNCHRVDCLVGGS